MLWSDVIELISITNTTNDLGNPIESKTYREVFTERKSIGMKEFYMAQQANLKPELTFIIQEIDYQNEKKIRYNNIEYYVIRIYNSGLDRIELVCGYL
jgi:SPP1 family predicted phage head-tail adaptor